MRYTVSLISRSDFSIYFFFTKRLIRGAVQPPAYMFPLLQAFSFCCCQIPILPMHSKNKGAKLPGLKGDILDPDFSSTCSVKQLNMNSQFSLSEGWVFALSSSPRLPLHQEKDEGTSRRYIQLVCWGLNQGGMPKEKQTECLKTVLFPEVFVELIITQVLY